MVAILGSPTANVSRAFGSVWRRASDLSRLLPAVCSVGFRKMKFLLQEWRAAKKPLIARFGHWSHPGCALTGGWLCCGGTSTWWQGRSSLGLEFIWVLQGRGQEHEQPAHVCQDWKSSVGNLPWRPFLFSPWYFYWNTAKHQFAPWYALLSHELIFRGTNTKWIMKHMSMCETINHLHWRRRQPCSANWWTLQPKCSRCKRPRQDFPLQWAGGIYCKSTVLWGE